MNLKLLKLLQDNDTPLIITVEEKGKQATITRDGVSIEEQSKDIFKHLKDALAFYPEEVWINGEKMEPTQWPGLAQVKIMEQDEDGWERNSKRTVALRVPVPPLGCNAIVGGVMTRVYLTNRQRKDTRTQYFIPKQDSALRHHVPLQIVTLTAFIEIEASEIETSEFKARESKNSEIEDREIKQVENQYGKSHLRVPKRSYLEKAVMNRAQAMIKRTMDRKELPKPYEGKAYARPMTGPRGAKHFTAAYPIGVMGTPILLDDDWDAIDNAKFTTIVENLYGIDAKHVPVVAGPKNLLGGMIIPEVGDETVRVENVTFDIDIDSDCETHAKNISMKIELEKDQVFRYPCHFHILGDCESEAEVKIIPGGINKDQLTDMLFQAFWLQEEWASWEDVKYERFELNERMHSLAMHITGETTEAVTREFQRMLERFHTVVPLPSKEKISVTSRDGRLQFTLNP